MIELIKLAIDKPMNAVVVCVCMVVASLHISVYELKEAMAVVKVEQIMDKEINNKVLDMSTTLAKIDNTVDIIWGQTKVFADTEKKIDRLITISEMEEGR